jgi:thiosulfate/3-mercaptopyruvate sulfurtransferase
VTRFGPLVTPAGVAARLGDPSLVLLEVNERPLVYHQGHIPGAHNLDWHRDLQDPVLRDVPGDEALRALWSRVGITGASDVVLYGDQHNWYAAYGYWLFRMHGLRRLAILDGGRQAWLAAGLPTSRDAPAIVSAAAPRPRLDPALRASAEDVVALLRAGGTLIDVRTAAEYRGDVLSEPGYPRESAQRGGHIPGARHIPWEIAIAPDGTFHDTAQLRALLEQGGVRLDAPTVSYCRIGERSAHSWFVLSELLGQRSARNYDGSWTEWGSMVGLPVAVGDAPGELPASVPRLEGRAAVKAVSREGR